MPNLLAETFNAAGADMADFVTIEPVDPMYRAVYADGSTLFVRHGREAMTEEIRAFAGREGRGRVRAVLRLVGTISTGRRCRRSSTPTSTRRSTW